MRTIVVALTLVVSLLPASSALAADAEMMRGSNYLHQTSDLNGDGVLDTVAIESTPFTHETPVAGIGGNESVVTARSGRDGATLWSKQIPAVRVVPIRIGADSRPGILVVDGPHTDYNPLTTAFVGESGGMRAGSGVEARALTLTALDGLTGASAWTRTFEAGPFVAAAGRVPTGETLRATVMNNHTAFVGVLDGDTSDSVLLTRLTRTDTPAGVNSTTSGVVLKGGDGTDAFKVDVTSTSARPVVRNGGDLDGDGADDLLFLRTLASGGLRAFSGATGTAIWDAPAVPVSDWFDVRHPGDLDADGHDEVFVAQSQGFADAADITTHVVDGATGAVRYTAAAGAVTHPVGDANGDGRSELATATVTDNVVKYRLLDVDGNLLDAREHVASVPEGGTFNFVYGSGPVGDVNGDGVTDLAHRVEYRQGNETVSDLTLVSGRTLSVIRDRARGVALGRAITAGSSDFLDITISQGQLELALVDGASGATAWTGHTPAFFEGATYVTANALTEDTNRDGSVDVLATVTLSKMRCSSVEVPDAGCALGQTSDFEVRTFALSGRDGSILWSI